MRIIFAQIKFLQVFYWTLPLMVLLKVFAGVLFLGRKWYFFLRPNWIWSPYTPDTYRTCNEQSSVGRTVKLTVQLRPNSRLGFFLFFHYVVILWHLTHGENSHVFTFSLKTSLRYITLILSKAVNYRHRRRPTLEAILLCRGIYLENIRCYLVAKTKTLATLKMLPLVLSVSSNACLC